MSLSLSLSLPPPCVCVCVCVLRFGTRTGTVSDLHSLGFFCHRQSSSCRMIWKGTFISIYIYIYTLYSRIVRCRKTLFSFLFPGLVRVCVCVNQCNREVCQRKRESEIIESFLRFVPLLKYLVRVFWFTPRDDVTRIRDDFFVTYPGPFINTPDLWRKNRHISGSFHKYPGFVTEKSSQIRVFSEKNRHKWFSMNHHITDPSTW